MDMIPWMGFAALIGFGAKWGYDKVKGYIDNRSQNKKEAERAQEAFIKTMEEEVSRGELAGEATA